MFTGIIERIGTIEVHRKQGNTLRLGIQAGFEPGSVRPGDSVAVDGVCLTLTEWKEESLLFDVSHETVAATNLRIRRKGDRVHLERALTLASRLGGHLVTGHVDGTGEILSSTRRGENRDVVCRVPGTVTPYLVPKGSVALNGVSLTVNQPSGGRFRVTLVPHTLRQTTLGDLGPGDPVNVEADILGKYVRHFVGGAAREGVDEQFLAEHGFLSPGDGT